MSRVIIQDKMNGVLLNLKGRIITMNAMGTQAEIVKQICRKRADCVSSKKRNQTSLHKEVKQHTDGSWMQHLPAFVVNKVK